MGFIAPDKVSDIHFYNVRLNLRKMTGYDGGVYDKRPCKGEGFVKGKVYGLYVEQASRLTVKDFFVSHEDVYYGGTCNQELK